MHGDADSESVRNGANGSIVTILLHSVIWWGDDENDAGCLTKREMRRRRGV